MEVQLQELADQADLNDVEMQQMGNNELYGHPIDFRIVGINAIPGDDDGIAEIPERPSNSNNDPNTLPNIPQNIQIEDDHVEQIPNELPHLHGDVQMEEHEQEPDIENQEQVIHPVVDFLNDRGISNEARKEVARLINPLNEDGSTNEDTRSGMLMKTDILTQTATHVTRQSETTEADENPQTVQELQNARIVNKVIQNYIDPDNENRL
ncbi:hypothetical protein WR25_01620 [Diploscapter pachys]|uniref:Uncharacterized protein n=1 Tax=Diploscapter pachys TaxID=2018661 RepID=A0A2A2LXN4_9BILA|nr:hypothetical protein WR25_01620 [Diploscapter pachys]